jgi:alpha-tubulin suppressor-like RCC1 family protein
MYNSAAIRADGFLFTWGDNREFQLGDGTVGNKSSPVQVGLSNQWTDISTGFASGGRLANNILYMWGVSPANGIGQAGDITSPVQLGSNAVTSSSPVQIGSSSWTAVSSRVRTTAAIRSDNILFTWGYGLNGQIGDGASLTRSSPVQIGSSSWTAVSAGGNPVLGIKQA